MFRFDCSTSREWAGPFAGVRAAGREPRLVNSPNGRRTAPTVCWTRERGMCGPAFGPGRENQMGD